MIDKAQMSLPNEYLTKSVCILGERWPVAPFTGQFADPVDASVVIHYSVDFEYRPYSIKTETNFTVIIFVHQFTQKHAIGKGRGNLVSEAAQTLVHGEIARYVAGLVNYLIDIVQGTFEESQDNPFPHIRRVGIRDFVSMDNYPVDKNGNRLGQGFSFANPAIDSRIAKRSIGIVSRVNFSTDTDAPIEKIKILRAVELLNSGYHSEALLISFAILDSFVQQAIEKMLKERQIPKARKFLRRIPEERMNTYLGPLLKILTGHSLEEDKPEAWKGLDKFNSKRNAAIHRGLDISYEDAKQGIETARDILVYLGTVSSVVSNLNFGRLPFLFEY
jgi:hypothetical protein